MKIKNNITAKKNDNTERCCRLFRYFVIIKTNQYHFDTQPLGSVPILVVTLVVVVVVGLVCFFVVVCFLVVAVLCFAVVVLR